MDRDCADCDLAAYGFVTDLRPPVLRSALLGCLAAAAAPHFRLTSGSPAGDDGAVMLIWNPTDLYDLGAQLSFLAVAAILWSSRLLARRAWRDDVSIALLEDSRFRA